MKIPYVSQYLNTLIVSSTACFLYAITTEQLIPISLNDLLQGLTILILTSDTSKLICPQNSTSKALLLHRE